MIEELYEVLTILITKLNSNFYICINVNHKPIHESLKTDFITRPVYSKEGGVIEF